ncbi:MAG: hypothetical protein ABJP39_05220, partial [Marinobacter alexandrii]|uniref:hypothetical protein n=1 Tax=Marinobacter alexandrii TaxID=2570351 RepID=UPI003299F133
MATPAAADIDGGSRYVSSPSPASFPGAVLPGSETTAHAGNEYGVSGCGGGSDSLILSENTELTTKAGKSGGEGNVDMEGEAPEPTSHAAEGVGGVDVGNILFEQGVDVDSSAEQALIVTTSTVNISAGERDEFTSALGGGGVAEEAFIK